MFTPEHRNILNRAITELETKVAKARAREAQIDQHINQRKGQLGDIERFRLATRRIVITAKREAAENALAKLYSHLAPIRTLPTEILAEIFQLAAAEEEAISKEVHGQPLRLDFHWNNFNEHRLIPRGLLVQEKLSHVCSYWRDVALSIPTLWHKLTFSVFTSDPDEPLIEENTGTIQRMGLWLERTKQAPLHITIFSERVPLLELWRWLLPEAPRIRVLRIYDQDATKLSQVLGTLPTMPLLECLELSSDTQSERGQRYLANSLPRLLDRGAPKLRELFVEKLSLPWPHVPWSNITRLVIMSRYTILRLSFAKLSMVLEAVAPRLRYFAYQNHTKPIEAEDLGSIGKAVEFSHLNTLEVNVSDTRVLLQWLSRHCFPVLRRCYLDIETSTGLEFQNITKAVVFGTKKSPQRTMMTNGNDNGTDEKLQQPEAQPAPNRGTGGEKERPRITFQRCRELTMGPCGNAQHGIGRFISLCFPSLQTFHSHTEGSPFQLEEIFDAFQVSCPKLVEVSGHHADFATVHRLINARRLNPEMTALTKVSLETIMIGPWTRSEVEKVREKVELVIEDGREPKPTTFESGISWKSIYSGSAWSGSGAGAGSMRERDTDDEDSEEERRRRKRRLDAAWPPRNGFGQSPALPVFSGVFFQASNSSNNHNNKSSGNMDLDK
ncbi:hypothetical protein FRC17_009489 [Serendipita sp. 399]|nr:hypothetical protein FRC17_009489 [Serendipita sp. 399]